jgi:hypothetical protein
MSSLDNDRCGATDADQSGHTHLRVSVSKYFSIKKETSAVAVAMLRSCCGCGLRGMVAVSTAGGCRSRSQRSGHQRRSVNEVSQPANSYSMDPEARQSRLTLLEHSQPKRSPQRQPWQPAPPAGYVTPSCRVAWLMRARAGVCTPKRSSRRCGRRYSRHTHCSPLC